MDWEGEVQANSDITVGGFEAGNVHVKVGTTLLFFGRRFFPCLMRASVIPLLTMSFSPCLGFHLLGANTTESS